MSTLELNGLLRASAEEARRQIEICNACRYCEGFCSVFPAVTRQRTFSLSDMTQLANLCHNCQGCYHACQYTAPHEFNLNLPAALAGVRTESWERWMWPRGVAAWVQRKPAASAGVLIVALFVLGALASGDAASGVFYQHFSHNLLVAVFAPLFLLPLLAIAMALRNYWKEVGGVCATVAEWRMALSQAGRMRNLSGGQDQGCQYEKGDRYSQARRHAHHAVMYGFLLCFASTSVATLMHYVWQLPAPYAWWSLPKLLGVPGGVLLTVGGVMLMRLKSRSDPALNSATRWGGDWAFLLTLTLTAASGLLLYAVSGTSAVRITLVFHLACVATLFVLTPYSKMVHGFFRLAALLREAQAQAGRGRS